MPTSTIFDAIPAELHPEKVTIHTMARTNWLGKASLLRARDLTLGGLVHRLADVHGDAPLVDEAGPDGVRLSYTDAAARVDAAAGVIARSIQPGDRVVIAMANAYDVFLLCAAASRAGGIAVPVNPQMTESEVDHVVADSGASLVLRAASDLGPSTGPPVGAPPAASTAAPGDVA